MDKLKVLLEDERAHVESLHMVEPSKHIPGHPKQKDPPMSPSPHKMKS